MKKKALGPSWWRRNTQSSGLCWCYGDRRHTGRGPSCEEEKGRRARCNERPDAHPPPPQFLFARRERSLSSLSFFPNRPPIRPVLSPLPSILLLFLKKKQTKLRAISFVCCFFFSDQEAVKTHDRREPDKNKRETKPGQHQIFPFTVDVVPSLHDRKKSGNHFDSRLPHFVCVCVLKERRQWGRPRQFSQIHTQRRPITRATGCDGKLGYCDKREPPNCRFPLTAQKRRQACAAENVPLLMLPHFQKKNNIKYLSLNKNICCDFFF